MKNTIISKGMLASLAGLWIASFGFSVQAADYDVDTSHAFVQFKISHMGFSTMVGGFKKFSGKFSWDKENPGASSVEITIETASLDTNWAERDKHLRSEDFLDVKKFPVASFKSSKYTGDSKGGKMEGVLTLHGVSKPLTLDVTAIGEGPDPWGGQRAGFEATATLRRADWGIGYELGPTSEVMQFELYLEGVMKK